MSHSDLTLPVDASGSVGRPPSRGGPLPPPIIDAEFSEAPRHLRDYFRVLYKYRWLAVTCFGVVVGLTALVTLLTPRRYTATTRLQMIRQPPIRLRLEDNVLRFDDEEGGAGTASNFIATQVAVLQSRDLAERVIRGRHLSDNDAFLHPTPYRRGLLSVGGGMLGLLRPRAWEGPEPTAVESGEEGDSGPADRALLDRYMRYLRVEDVRGTDLLEIRFTTPSPSLSAFLAAAHAEAYLQANEEARRGNDVTAKEFLARKLREAREQVEHAGAALRTFATQHPNVAINEEQNTIAQRITELSSQLTKAESARVALQTRYEFLTKPHTDPLSYFLDRPGVQKLHLALLDLRAQEAGLDQRLGSRHPQMLELRRQEEEIERQLHGELAQEVDAVRSRNDAARLREEELRRKLGRLAAAAIDLRDLGSRYDLLKNEVQTSRSLHDSLLKQQMETAVNSELVASTVRVVDRSEVPEWPSRPNVPLNLVLGVLAGLVLAVGAAFACEYFDPSVKTSSEVERMLQLPILATIPNFELDRGVARRLGRQALSTNGNGAGSNGDHDVASENDLVVLREPRSRMAEAFRTLRTAVLFSIPDLRPRVIAVASARGGEGKTVATVNLATALAEAGSRVVLLDADLRHPRCHRLLGLDPRCGLASVLSGEMALADVMVTLGSPALAFVPAGPPPTNPAELVGRVGGDTLIRSDFRLITATNACLEQAVRGGTLRSDLFHRLKVAEVRLPPLRERREDIPLLVSYFIDQKRQRLDRPQVHRVSRLAVDVLMAYEWPGNVRELEHVVERAMIECTGDTIEERHLLFRPIGEMDDPIADVGAPFRAARLRAIQRFEAGYLRSQLRRYGGSVTKVARHADVTPKHVRALLKRYGINRRSFLPARSTRPTPSAVARPRA